VCACVATRKWFVTLSAIICPITFAIDAPFGRFATDDAFSIDGALFLVSLSAPVIERADMTYLNR
jgi:hypothetical protein